MAESLSKVETLDKLDLGKSGITDQALCLIINKIPNQTWLLDLSYNFKL